MDAGFDVFDKGLFNSTVEPNVQNVCFINCIVQVLRALGFVVKGCGKCDLHHLETAPSSPSASSETANLKPEIESAAEPKSKRAKLTSSCADGGSEAPKKVCFDCSWAHALRRPHISIHDTMQRDGKSCLRVAVVAADFVRSFTTIWPQYKKGEQCDAEELFGYLSRRWKSIFLHTKREVVCTDSCMECFLERPRYDVEHAIHIPLTRTRLGEKIVVTS